MLVFTLPGVHHSEPVCACGHFFLARWGKRLAPVCFPVEPRRGVGSPFQSLLSLVEGKCSQQDVLGCCTGVYVDVWLVSTRNCKIFPVEGAGSLALHVHIDCYIFKWGEDRRHVKHQNKRDEGVGIIQFTVWLSTDCYAVFLFFYF